MGKFKYRFRDIIFVSFPLKRIFIHIFHKQNIYEHNEAQIFKKTKHILSIFLSLVFLCAGQIVLSPSPPRAHHFFCCCPGVPITLIFTCPALCNHQNHPFFECPALFYHTHIFSDPGAARGGYLIGRMFVGRK